LGALAVSASLLAGCAAQEPANAPPEQARVPAVTPEQAQAARKAEQEKLGAEARAMLAQAETDVQRARSKRALWLKAWQDLLAARKAVAQSDYENAIVLAKSASDLAQLGLEQLAYPAVK
jgi:hypothetical protein